MKCDYCDYEWEKRVKNPKECPECKRRLKHDLVNLDGNS
jgi:predicted Zn-ribbon and HTH transcriptional regulator